MSGKPRQSGIPTPGKASAIPTPGRSRASSRAAQNPAAPIPEADYYVNAFADAIKANDPARHRTGRVSDLSVTSLSPQSTSFVLQSGRRSVARTPSVTSSSSAEPTQAIRSPPSVRPSEVSRRSASRNGRVFEVGDNVRIESLGYEGTLRYIGEIDGKVGLWAGVELSGGFSGKGKNNGSVNQKQYFLCPPNCGVFVSTTKLSPPTVGPGAFYRPSSVASTSSRSDRIMSSTSGRVTPSLSTPFPPSALTTSKSSGRVTPTSSRVTPSPSYGNLPTSGRPRPPATSKSTPIQGSISDSFTSKFTAGSRASKYVSMTAKQLKSRPPGEVAIPTTPPRKIYDNDNASQKSLGTPSLSLQPSLIFNTPKPSLGGRSTVGQEGPLSKVRTPLNTPRARIPSAIAMPPPPSPSRSISRNNLNDELSPSYSNGDSHLGSTQSLFSVGSAAGMEQQAHIDRLQSRLDALEYENERLRSTIDKPNPPGFDVSSSEAHAEEASSLMSRISELEARLQAAESSFDERDSVIDSLQNTLADSEKQKGEGDQRIAEFETKLAESVASAKSLSKIIEQKEAKEQELASILNTRKSEIDALEGQVDHLSAQLEDERKELGGQINELRQAGQETIALYEERLSESDGQRFELEDRIASLEARLRKALEPSQVAPLPSSSAAQIDNESLRDQVLHLQKKITGLEDTLDDVQSASERDANAQRERLKRAKDKEDAMRKEMVEGRKELERIIKLEDNARTRVQEIEEALRESTMALENARAEVEGMRVELVNLDGALADGKSGDLPSRLAEIVQRASAERSRFTAEITRLNSLLDVSRNAEQRSIERLRSGIHDEHAADFKDTMQSINITMADNGGFDLRSSLADQSAELHSLKKKLNRDIPVSPGPQDSFKPLNGSPVSSKHDYSTLRDEITGLKHIVQELQKENLATSQRNKLLESENKLLLSETDQLRQELKILEDNLDQTILHEEQTADSGATISSTGDIGSLQRTLKEQKVRFENELEQLRKRLTEAEMKNARLSHDLNKEISELETLVESKIYREDELEQELERTKEKLARYQKKVSKGNTQSPEVLSQVSSTPGSHLDDLCEICEKPGHDIFTCDLLKERTDTHRETYSSTSSDLFCEDCERYGHVAADCPHSLDVF